MQDKIDMRSDHLNLVKDILHSHLPDGVKVWVFGSRATWKAKEYSDLDLMLESDSGGKIDFSVLARIDSDFEDSSLPYKVDVVDAVAISDKFRKHIEKDKVFFISSEQKTIGDYFRLQGGYSFKTKDFQDSGVPVIKIANITSGKKIDISSCQYVGEQTAMEAAKLKTEVDDVLIAMTGANVGKVAQISKYDPVCFVNQRVGRFLPKQNCSYSKDFLYYFSSSEKSYKYFASAAYGTGQPNISGSLIEALELPNTDPKTANKAAKILRSLDDKIEINGRINETLEAMAEAIFKSWFVNFDPVKAKMAVLEKGGSDEEALTAAMMCISGKSKEALAKFKKEDEENYTSLLETASLFPSSFTDSPLGPIPPGWQVKGLDEVAHYLNGLALQKFRPENKNDFLPVLKIAQLKKGSTDGAEKATPKIPPKYIVDNGDMIFSWSASLFVDIWCGGKAALNQHLFKVTSEKYPKWLFYFFTKYHLSEFKRIAKGKTVTMGHINRVHLTEAKCAIPSDEFIAKVGSAIDNLLQMQTELRLQSRTIAEARDSLLPKLLSGKIQSINNIEEINA